MKNFLKRVYFALVQLGLDFRVTFRALRGLPYYIKDFLKFKACYDGKVNIMPCFVDRFEEAGRVRNEYFWQDLLVARLVFENKPKKHIDIGSSLYGFVSHVASYRQIEVVDVRPLDAVIHNVIFKK